jgi:N-acetylmuramoyl-L-alanine amidase
MNSVLSGSDGSDSKGTQSIKYANVVLSARDQIYQYFNLSTPKEQYVVVIDPGHGGFNPSGLYNMGAIGINNIYESEVVLDISLKVGQILKSYGLDVQYTRTKEKDPSNPYDLSDRLRLTESFKPNVLLSIHANSFTSSTANGVETYWRTSQSKWFSTIVHNQYLNQVQLKDRGVKQDTTLYMLQGQSYPSAMLEVGFITSPVDNALLSTADGQTKAAQGIAQGIIKFFGIDTKPLTH